MGLNPFFLAPGGVVFGTQLFRWLRRLAGPLGDPVVFSAVLLALSVGVPSARSEPAMAPVPVIPVTVDCIDRAALDQQVPREILYAIGVVEGGKVGDIVYNKNGSYDLGVFQINSHWLGMLANLARRCDSWVRTRVEVAACP